jgi:chemotaxis protein MotB
MPTDAILEIEGHTDSDPMKGSAYKDNWDLSSARASAVVRVLAREGVSPVRMRATGRAHFEPLVPEVDERGFAILSNKAMNRRIVIRLRVKPTQAGVEPSKAKKKKGS